MDISIGNSVVLVLVVIISIMRLHHMLINRIPRELATTSVAEVSAAVAFDMVASVNLEKPQSVAVLYQRKVVLTFSTITPHEGHAMTLTLSVLPFRPVSPRHSSHLKS